MQRIRNFTILFLTSNFCCVRNVICFLLGNSLASEFYVPMFQNTLSLNSSWVSRYLPAYEDGTVFQNVGM